jgi:hypothetical protein
MSYPPRRGRVTRLAPAAARLAPQHRKLTRQRERTGDLSSRTLYFTFSGARRAARSQVTFVSPEHVPDFVGEESWFEMELVNGHSLVLVAGRAPGRSARRPAGPDGEAKR